MLRQEQTLVALHEGGTRDIATAVRPLTWHTEDRDKIKSARRALVTFPFDFADTKPVRFRFHAAAAPVVSPAVDNAAAYVLTADGIVITCRDGSRLAARVVAPLRTTTDAPRLEVVEQNAYYRWERLHVPDPIWPRVIEVRMDALGTVAVVAHLQRNVAGNDWAPDFGWEITSNSAASVLEKDSGRVPVGDQPVSLSLTSESAPALLFGRSAIRLYQPVASFTQHGSISLKPAKDGFTWRYLRSSATDKVPMQETAWRKAEFVVAPAGQARLTRTLQSPHEWTTDWRLWDQLYQTGAPLDLSGQPELAAIADYHRQAILKSMCLGSDFGNVTEFSDDRSRGGDEIGMNRLNHCAPIFAQGWRNGDRALLDVAVLWCDNLHDLSIWWGPKKFGGTRYNNDRANGLIPPDNDRTFMWRSNSSVHFCTKGYDSLYLAYEETGDPRMSEALQAQVEYAVRWVSAVEETRNIGDVRDLVRLARFTDRNFYREAAQRLFVEYRSRAASGGLVSQDGAPIESILPFIDDDAVGRPHGFAKPYILGYALAGLPELLALVPNEPGLRDVVHNTADFMAENIDPLGGWRYPHPRSSRVILSQALEHAWQLVQADRALGPDAKHLDAIERVLRQRVAGLRRTGRLLHMSIGWELATGRIKDASEIYSFYRYPSERDSFRDYREGGLQLGDSSPEGLVYFPEVLRYYLEHRTAEALFADPKPDEPLGLVLSRQAPRAVVPNPAPERLPTLTSWKKGKELLVSIRFPGPGGLASDAWCYEGGFDFVRAEPAPDGRLTLYHRVHDHPHVLLATVVTPEEGAVDFSARLIVDPTVKNAPALPEDIPAPNLCWQLRPDPAYSSYPEVYPEFTRRCFIFTEKGRTFLSETDRQPIPVRPANDRENNPPWVQTYFPAGQPRPGTPKDSWSGFSSSPFVSPLIGVVSRDRKHLAALASVSAPMMSQAWHDCLHNNPPWLPVGAPPVERRWHVRVYFMENDPAALLARTQRDFTAESATGIPREPEYQTVGVIKGLPVMRDKMVSRLDYPLSFASGKFADFAAWQQQARERFRAALLPPPPAAPFNPIVIAEEDRGSYVARKVVLSLTGDSRVLALMLVPKGPGPFPAALLLHDHGARFDIGKEKMIRPFAGDTDKLFSAVEWSKELYGGRIIGDELARRGYVCFSADVLNWSDRGGGGYKGQQALASNLLHLGTSFAGLTAHEDLRAAEFLASLPMVDPQRVTAMGLSMGGFRTWQVAALSNHIVAGVSICWMATNKGLMVPGNNQTGGDSAYSMLHPGIFNALDYPDLASIACPKPMLFYGGRRDSLFPVQSVAEAYAKMGKIWSSQGAEDRLHSRIWDVGHEFNVAMQDEAFAWLELQLARAKN